MLIKTRMRNEKTRCKVAGGKELFVLGFLFSIVKLKV